MTKAIVLFCEKVGEYLSKISLGHLQTIEISEDIFRLEITRTWWEDFYKTDEISIFKRNKWIGSLFVDLCFDETNSSVFKKSTLSNDSFDRNIMKKHQKKTTLFLEKTYKIIVNYSKSLINN